jgi:hypothetical protein
LALVPSEQSLFLSERARQPSDCQKVNLGALIALLSGNWSKHLNNIQHAIPKVPFLFKMSQISHPKTVRMKKHLQFFVAPSFLLEVKHQESRLTGLSDLG